MCDAVMTKTYVARYYWATLLAFFDNVTVFLLSQSSRFSFMTLIIVYIAAGGSVLSPRQLLDIEAEYEIL